MVRLIEYLYTGTLALSNEFEWRLVSNDKEPISRLIVSTEEILALSLMNT